jgi:hypothetical protein
MTSMQENRTRRLPKMLSILFGSSLVALAMAATSRPASAWTSCDSCYSCKWSTAGFYCGSKTTVGADCCASEISPDGGLYCTVYGTWCS